MRCIYGGMAFPIQLEGHYDGIDAKGRLVHFEEPPKEGHWVGNYNSKGDPSPPYGRYTKLAGQWWIVAEEHYIPKTSVFLVYVGVYDPNPYSIHATRAGAEACVAESLARGCPIGMDIGEMELLP